MSRRRGRRGGDEHCNKESNTWRAEALSVMKELDAVLKRGK